MRILHLTPGCFDKGGISRYSRYQIKALREIVGQQNIRALSLLGPQQDGFEEDFAVTWHAGARFGEITQVQRAAFAGHAMRHAMIWRPHVIVSAHANFAPLLNGLGRLSASQTVLNVYGLELWSGLTKSRKAHISKVGTVISDCHFSARYVTEGRLHARTPEVIWDCVDLHRFKPAPQDPAVAKRYGLPDPDKHVIVMSLGRLAPEAAHKGFDRLITSFSRLTSQHPTARLVIAGRGGDRPRLEALAASLAVADRVIFTGAIDEADLAAVYRHASVFSLVSDRGPGRGEGIPLTPLEAMACGVPIIVGNEDGSQEAVVDGRNGFVISPRDLDNHAHVIAMIADSPELRRQMGVQARAVANECFSYENFREKLAILLESLRAQGRSHTGLLAASK